MHIVVKFFLIFTILSCGKAPIFYNFESEDIQSLNSQSLTLGEQYEFGIEWLNAPKSLVNSPFKLRFWDNSHSIWGPYQRVSPKLCVMLWMKMKDGSEHGSSPVVIKEIKDNGLYYLIDEVFFVMSGQWQIRVRLIEENQKCGALKSDSFIEEKVFEVYIP